MAEPENEITEVEGSVEEFANGFIIKPLDPSVKESSEKTLPIFHGSPEFPYEKVKSFTHRPSKIWITQNQRIANIEVIEHLENDEVKPKPKTFIQRLLRLLPDNPF